VNFLRISGLAFVGLCIISIFAAVAVGNQTSLFIAAIAFGIIGNVLWWLGRSRPPVEEEDCPNPPADNNQPP